MTDHTELLHRFAEVALARFKGEGSLYCTKVETAIRESSYWSFVSALDALGYGADHIVIDLAVREAYRAYVGDNGAYDPNGDWIAWTTGCNATLIAAVKNLNLTR